ncbi:MAG TPA: co-chaperone GroES [Saprospiraceae bacterium]|nr:co-chaperone GroES [Saprospiraceae bacterium]
MKPVNDRILVKPHQAEETTKGGIIIPDTVKEKPNRGEIVAVGPGKDGKKLSLKVGETVIYGKFAGQELELDGEIFIIMREDDVLLVL